jgi:hypothetical protein
MGPVRRTINLICALALTGTGVFFFFYLLLYAPHANARWVLLVGAAVAGFLGLYWLWVDFINVNTDPRPER